MQNDVSGYIRAINYTSITYRGSLVYASHAQLDAERGRVTIIPADGNGPIITSVESFIACCHESGIQPIGAVVQTFSSRW